MNCEQVRQLLHGYLDDELDLTTALAIETHLSSCLDCGKQLDAARVVSRAVSQSATYYRAAAALRNQLNLGPKPSNSWFNRPMAFSGLAAAVLLMAGTMLLLAPPRGSQGQINELVDSHLRSLQADHLYDVQSTDQHTVKPWFNGKLDFSPPVVDLSAEGFPLVGGRLDYVGQQKVAALIFKRGKHIINLFICPGTRAPKTEATHGFNLVAFECNGMSCWAVSDLNAVELQQFTVLFAAQKAASTRF